MTPQFTSSELNSLLELEFAEGRYNSAEEAIFAGQRVLREHRETFAQVSARLRSLEDGRAIVLEGDQAMAEYLAAIDTEVDAEIRQQLASYAFMDPNSCDFGASHFKR